MARRWVKIWVHESLTGTIRFDFSPDERGVWYDLLLLAGNCRQEGLIAAGNGTPYPNNWIAGTLNVPIKLLESTLKKCEDTERIEINGQGIKILNWGKYQSEYERQKPYREAKGEGKSINKKCAQCGYKAKTNLIHCPECAKGGKEIELVKDYTAGKYGHMVHT